MREVLIVVFWIWFAVAIGIYGFRIWRRVTKGPKSEREARQLAEEGRSVGLGERVGRRSPPPLPDGPLEPRLPRSLQNLPPPAADGPLPGAPITGAADTSGGSPATAGGSPASSGGSPAAASTPTGADPAAAPAADPAPLRPAGPPTVAEALRGIDLPCELVPVVGGEDPAIVSGHRVVFTTREASVRAVAAGLADELERLGYQVADTAGDADARVLTAVRGDVTVAARVATEADGAVNADVTT